MKTEPQMHPSARVKLTEHVEVSPAGDVCPKGTHISVKHIAFLHEYANKHAREIRGRYPAALTLAQIYFALGYYHLNRDHFDAQIAEDRLLNSQDALKRNGRLPTASVSAILEAAEIEARPPVVKTTLAKR